jgi:predicted CXXCH cytochrome family protein
MRIFLALMLAVLSSPAHVAAGGKAKMLRQPPEKVCTQCHDGVKDEGRFELESYMSRVEH